MLLRGCSDEAGKESLRRPCCPPSWEWKGRGTERRRKNSITRRELCSWEEAVVVERGGGGKSESDRGRQHDQEDSFSPFIELVKLRETKACSH